jgi:hypothetical protein
MNETARIASDNRKDRERDSIWPTENRWSFVRFVRADCGVVGGNGTTLG